MAKPAAQAASPRIAVQQRDHHRHVRPAYGDDRHDAKQEGQGDERVQVVGVGRLKAEQRADDDDGKQQERVDDALSGENVGPPGDDLAQFAEGHKAAGEGQAADENGQEDGRIGEGGVAGGVQGGPAHEQAGDAAEAVEDRHHFRHGGHGDHAGGEGADEGARQHARGDPDIAHDGLVQQGDDNGEQHAQGGHEVAVARRRRRAQHLQAEDEQDG